MASTASSTPRALLTCADKAAGITLYTAVGYAPSVYKAFQQQTGITVNAVQDSTGNLLAKISAEGTNPQWDVAWFEGNIVMLGLDNQGFLLHWDSPSIANYTSLGLSVVPENHAYYPTGVTAAAAIVYNTAKVPTAGLPKDWNDLLKPEYKDLVAESDPAFSGPSFQHIAAIAQIMGGLEQGEAYLTKLKANGLKVFQTGDPTMNSILTGDRVFAIVQDSAGYKAKARGETVDIIYPTSGVGILPSVAAVSASGKHQGCGQQFVNYILSIEGQQAAVNAQPQTGDLFFVDLIKGVTPVVKRQNDGINFVTLDIATWAKAEKEYKQWFRDNIAQ